MGCSVFAESMGLFHKGSGGKGVAPGDVCLSPPPPPTGPAPVPYVNSLQASNLTKGSKKVKIQGEPTALENKSEISTSMGNEAGTQGGNVVTHKTKGKGFFTSWSFTVTIEGKGVCRHGDMMGQNSASMPYGCVDAAAMTTFSQLLKSENAGKPCTKKYKRGSEGRIRKAQRDAIAGTACWWAPCTAPATVPDHQPPLVVAWGMGGCHEPDVYKEWAKRPAATPRGHCLLHSNMQRNLLSGTYRKLEAVKAIANFLAGLAG